jgi:tRNA A-37 threonylcarbamoyl transferase component Bud32
LLKQEEEERKAMQEAEILKEKKRKEYVLKQKQKLSGYHDRIRTEAEQIQKLYQLGIDPSELM